MVKDFAEIIAVWPGGRRAFAADIGVSSEVVKKMHDRNSIDSAYWIELVKQAKDKNINGVTLEFLAGLKAKKRPSLVNEHVAA